MQERFFKKTKKQEKKMLSNNAKLILDSSFRTTIEGPFEIKLGSQLEVK